MSTAQQLDIQQVNPAVFVNPSPVLDAALWWAAQGVPVLPCKEIDPGMKSPYIKGGFHGASTDPETIGNWWRYWPNAMLGLVCNEQSGFWVLDIDKKPGVDGAQWLFDIPQALPETLTEETPTKGVHYYFRNFDGIKRSIGKIAPGVDVITNGLVVAAPSVREDGEYTLFADLPIAETPQWLADLIVPKAKPSKKTAKLITGVSGAVSLYGRKALEDEAASLAATPGGQQNESLNTSAFRMGQLVGGGHLSRDVARDVLWSAIQGWADLDAHKSAGTLDRGLEAGMLEPKGPSPFDLPEDSPLFPLVSKEKIPTDASQSISVPAPALPTEDSIALEFKVRHKGKFLYCHDSGAWFRWDGVRWQKDRMRYPLQLMRELCREMNEGGKPTLGKLVTASGALRFAAGDPDMAVTGEIWDSDPCLIGTPGGVVDLRSGVLTRGTSDQYITKITGAAPADAADCPLWYQFLNDATRGDQELQRFMQQVAGYCLTGLTLEHALFFIYGPGGNGKSVFLNILNAILADYATTSALTTFTASNSDQHPTDLAMLRGARLVSVSETEEGRAWAESRIKQLTGGDKITARFMRQDFFEYIPQFKLLIVGNHQPALRNVDDAARRRFNIIPFVHKPTKPDPELEKKLRSELPAIFRWAIDGCLDWQRNGLVRPESVIAATQEYFDSQDMFGRWFDECCIRVPKEWTETAKLYAAWSVYAKRNGEESGDVRKFGSMLAKAGFKSDTRYNKRGWLGLSLPDKSEWQRDYDK